MSLYECYRLFLECQNGYNVSHFFMVIDPTKFLPLDDFVSNMQSMVDRIREMPTLEGADSVMVPGDPEKKTKAVRLNTGIPILSNLFDEFLEVSSDFEKAIKGK